MAIFGKIQVEAKAQVNDMIRIDVSKSFVSKDEANVTKVEVTPETGAGTVDVFNSDQSEWYLDWAYTSDGTKTITLEITTDGTPESVTETIEVLTEADDALLSTDKDLLAEEPQILKWLPLGKNSFIYLHRKARDLIIDEIDRQGYTDTDGNRLTADALVDKEEFKTWSKYMVLRLLFDELWNETEDVFWNKARHYAAREEVAKNRYRLPIDFDGDGTVQDNEQLLYQTVRIRRD